MKLHCWRALKKKEQQLQSTCRDRQNKTKQNIKSYTALSLNISATAVVKSNDQNLHKLCFCAFLLVHCAQLTVYPFKERAPLAACCPHGNIRCVPENKYLISLWSTNGFFRFCHCAGAEIGVTWKRRQDEMKDTNDLTKSEIFSWMPGNGEENLRGRPLVCAHCHVPQNQPKCCWTSCKTIFQWILNHFS